MTAKEILQKHFGYSEFREGQVEIIESIMSGNDTFAVMPTGAGKSICYQVPAMMKSGITLVISPLISLMHDQVISLKQVGIPAAYINSSLTPLQIQNVFSNANEGKYKIIYVAPERLNTVQFVDFALNVEISMVTIDEAHCISQWGQDFRPSYADIPSFISKLQTRPIVSAFTATATEKVKIDVINLLQLRNQKVFVTGFDRPNLYFEVQRPKNKPETLLEIIKENSKESGIIYCTSRNNVEKITELLCDNGYRATKYHAGLTTEERKQNQEEFSNDIETIMVATNAFGMGIDKSNVNFVIHFNMPKDVESYYQEAGRAGRDGTEAKCILLYSAQDVMTIKWMIENNENDGANLSFEEQQHLKEREYERLNIMNAYCTTTSCLREYILNYFGENAEKFCGNCSNCNSENEIVDITEITRKIITCVVELKERFGASMVVNILRGIKSENIISRGFDTFSTFNSTKTSDKELSLIISNLVGLGYLKQEGTKFPILRIGHNAKSVLNDGKIVTLAIPTELLKSTKTVKGTKVSVTGKQQDSDYDVSLFEVLRSVRTRLAVENKIPAYMVFDDKTLKNLSNEKPTTKEGMLNVSGVGEVKLSRFGDKFLTAITEFMDGNLNNDVKEIIIVQKLPKEIIANLKSYIDNAKISEFTRAVKDQIEEKGYKFNVTIAMISDFLVKRGYLGKEYNEDTKRNSHIPTQYGLANGVSRVDGEIKEKKYITNGFSKEVQQLVIDNLNTICEEKTYNKQ